MDRTEQTPRPPVWAALLISAGYALLLALPALALAWLRPDSAGAELALFPPPALAIALAAAALCAGGSAFLRIRENLRSIPLRTRSLLCAPIPLLAGQQALVGIAGMPAASFAILFIAVVLIAVLVRDLRKHSLLCAALCCPMLLWTLAVAAQRYAAAMVLP